TRRSVQQVDHVVQAGGEVMNVLTIDRRDEALVDPLVDGRRQQIGFVLHVFDRSDMRLHALRITQQVVQHPRGRRKMLGELIEEVEELLVAWDQPTEHVAPDGDLRSGCTKIPAPAVSANPRLEAWRSAEAALPRGV